MFRPDGFTLIELMVVVLVIGVLAAIAIPNYMSMQDQAKEAQVKNHAHALQLAAEDYSVRNDGTYSDAAADLMPLLPGGALMKNAFTGVVSEPRFAAMAAGTGQVGIVTTLQGGQPVGYVINGFGRNVEILRYSNGS